MRDLDCPNTAGPRRYLSRIESKCAIRTPSRSVIIPFQLPLTWVDYMEAIFVELPPFQRLREEYFDDDAFRGLQVALLKNPIAGDVIKGTGGLRKFRCGDERTWKGQAGRTARDLLLEKFAQSILVVYRLR